MVEIDEMQIFSQFVPIDLSSNFRVANIQLCFLVVTSSGLEAKGNFP